MDFANRLTIKDCLHLHANGFEISFNDGKHVTCTKTEKAPQQLHTAKGAIRK